MSMILEAILLTINTYLIYDHPSSLGIAVEVLLICMFIIVCINHCTKNKD